MPITAGEIRAQMVLDASGFSQGAAQAQTSLDTLTAAGERVANAVGSAEARLTSSASAIAAAMSEAGNGSAQLDQLAARADQAGARVDILAQQAATMAEKLAAAQQAAAESGEALAAMQDSAAASAENLAAAQQALEELQQSGTASAEALREAQASVDEFTEEGAMLEAQVQQLTAAHEANNAAVAEAEPCYRQLIARLNGAEAAADAASLKFSAMTDSLSAVDGGGLSGITGTLAQLGTSTLIRASRSMGTIAAGAMGLRSGTMVGVLASRTLSTTLTTLVKTLGIAKFGMIGAGAAAVYLGYQLFKAATDVEDSTDRWQKLYEAVDATSHVDFKALVNADIQLDTTGLSDKVQSVYKQIGDALTDGKPDTEAVIAEIEGNAKEMFSSVRQRIQQWYDAEMAGLDLSTTAGLKKAQELTGEYNTLMDRVDALDDSTGAWIASYAGKSTKECEAALTQLETLEQEMERLAKRADEQAALVTSNQRAAFTAATQGLTTDETTVANATQYVVFRYSMDLQNANDDYDRTAAELWQEYQKKLQAATGEQERIELEEEYSVKLKQNESDRQAEITRLRNDYKRDLSAIMQGVAQSAMRDDPELAAAIQDAVNGNFKKLGELNLDNRPLVKAMKGMIEAGVFEGFTDADLSTTEGQMQQLVNMLSYGLTDARDAWKDLGMRGEAKGWFADALHFFGISTPVDSLDFGASLRKMVEGINEAMEAGDPEAVRQYVQAFVDGMNPPEADWAGDETYIDRAAKWIHELYDAANDPNANTAMLTEQTDALADMLALVRQMDAENANDFAFLDGLAQALTASGIETDAEHVAQALEKVYEAATGRPAPEQPLPPGDYLKADGYTKPLTVPVEVEPKAEPQAGAHLFDEVFAEQEPATVTVPADVTVEPEKVTLPSPEELGFDNWQEASPLGNAIASLLVPAEVPVEVKPEVTPANFDELEAMWAEEGESAAGAVAAGMADNAGEAESAARAVAAEATGVLGGMSDEFSAAGDNAGGAFVGALRGYIAEAAAAGTAIGSAAYNALRDSLEIHSPSRKTRWLGRMGGRGFALGVGDEVLLARQNMERLAGGALGAAAGVTRNDQHTWNNTINNPTVRSREDLRRMSRSLARLNTEAAYGIT